MTQVELLQRLQEEYNIEHGIETKTKKKTLDLLTQAKNFSASIKHLLTINKVPYANEEDDNTYEEYLLSDNEDSSLPNKKTKSKKQSNVKDAEDDVEERIASIKNKLRQKKGPTTERQQKKREAKKLKRSKGVQKILLSSAKNLKNENIKHQKLKGSIKTEGDELEDDKSLVKPLQANASQPTFNQEGKIVYSKVDFAANPGGKVKRSHQNPKEILKKLKDTKKHINELKEQGETEKAAEIQNDIAWKKAFDKVEGKKVKDDTKLLQKAIKKRKVEKRKAKTKWTDRKAKVDHDIAKRQKKRQDNVDKRSKDKKNRKLKKASKKGRVIPGY